MAMTREEAYNEKLRPFKEVFLEHFNKTSAMNAWVETRFQIANAEPKRVNDKNRTVLTFDLEAHGIFVDNRPNTDVLWFCIGVSGGEHCLLFFDDKGTEYDPDYDGIIEFETQEELRQKMELCFKSRYRRTTGSSADAACHVLERVLHLLD